MFVLDNNSPANNSQLDRDTALVNRNESSLNSQDEIFGIYNPDDPMIRKAIEITIAKGKFSTAMLQTYLGKGHSWVAGLANWLELLGIISEPNGNKPRDILVDSLDEFDAIVEQTIKEATVKNKKK